MPGGDDLFSNDYFEARARFLAAAGVLNLPIESYIHPHIPDPRGELAIDTCVFGPEDAASVMFVTSGIHGVEGLMGSAVQLGILRRWQVEELPKGLKLVLVHGVNPVGFANFRRVNEDNIDLNRNFRDFSAAIPPNEDYGKIHAALCPRYWQGVGREKAEAELAVFVAEFGQDFLERRVLRGQYEFADGIFYGGDKPAWSTLKMGEIFAGFCAGLENLGIVDLHTGVGEPGEGVPIRPDEGSSGRPSVAGPMVNALDAYKPSGNFLKIIFEIGTLPMSEIIDAHRADNWLMREGDEASLVGQRIRQNLKDALVMPNAHWRQCVWDESANQIESAIAELMD